MANRPEQSSINCSFPIQKYNKQEQNVLSFQNTQEHHEDNYLGISLEIPILVYMLGFELEKKVLHHHNHRLCRSKMSCGQVGFLGLPLLADSQGALPFLYLEFLKQMSY